jgi:hypothetical protein
MWSGSEIFVILVCGSVHPLRPLWDRYVNKKSQPSSYDVQHNNKSYIAGAYAGTNPNSKNKTGDQASAQLNLSINTRTDIEISSTRKGSGSLSEEELKRDPWEL